MVDSNGASIVFVPSRIWPVFTENEWARGGSGLAKLFTAMGNSIPGVATSTRRGHDATVGHVRCRRQPLATLVPAGAMPWGPIPAATPAAIPPTGESVDHLAALVGRGQQTLPGGPHGRLPVAARQGKLGHAISGGGHRQGDLGGEPLRTGGGPQVGVGAHVGEGAHEHAGLRVPMSMHISVVTPMLWERIVTSAPRTISLPTSRLTLQACYGLVN